MQENDSCGKPLSLSETGVNQEMKVLRFHLGLQNNKQNNLNAFVSFILKHSL